MLGAGRKHLGARQDQKVPAQSNVESGRPGVFPRKVGTGSLSMPRWLGSGSLASKGGELL